MAIKYYGELTKKFYDTEDACEMAELEFSEKIEEAKRKKEADVAERKADAVLIEEKFEAASKAKQEYNDALKAFCEKWGAYHKSIDASTIKNSNCSVWDLFNFMF